MEYSHWRIGQSHMNRPGRSVGGLDMCKIMWGVGGEGESDSYSESLQPGVEGAEKSES
jgi:hypothetical protein